MPKNKKESSDSDSDSGPDDPTPAKKQKSEPKRAKPADDDDEEMLPLSKQRFISVSEFRGRPMINIREYYTDNNGDQKPGRKGISLSAEQWQALKKHIEAVDNRLKKF